MYHTQNLGKEGDAFVIMDRQKIYVPFALPDEVFTGDFNPETKGWDNIHIVTPSPHRRQAECNNFMLCGGCQFQHFSSELYQTFKQESFTQIFETIGIPSTKISSIKLCDPSGRRRTTLSFFKKDGQVVCGYKMRASQKIISAKGCTIVVPVLREIIDKLPTLFADYIPENTQAKLHLTACDNGVDAVLRGVKPPKVKELADFITGCQNFFPDIIRLTWDDECVMQNEVPIVTFGGYEVKIAPEMFLQPSKQGEDFLLELILPSLKKLGKKAKIADLFAGAGTFSLPLSHYVAVSAFENATGSLACLQEAVQKYGLQKKITVHARDLYRDALSPLELNTYHAVLADPPRQGMKHRRKIWHVPKCHSLSWCFAILKPQHEISRF